MNTTEQDRGNALAELGFAIECAGPLPGVETEFNKNWPHIAYAVRLMFKGREILSTPYKMGIGHVAIAKAPSARVLGLTTYEEFMLDTWKQKPQANFKDKELQAQVAAKLAKYQKVAPSLSDVMQSLLGDGDAFFSGLTFEEWCSSFGYDSDSRKAEAIYKVCDETGRKLSRISKDALDAARKILEDY
jgi:hypothetical protein